MDFDLHCIQDACAKLPPSDLAPCSPPHRQPDLKRNKLGDSYSVPPKVMRWFIKLIKYYSEEYQKASVYYLLVGVIGVMHQWYRKLGPYSDDTIGYSWYIGAVFTMIYDPIPSVPTPWKPRTTTCQIASDDLKRTCTWPAVFWVPWWPPCVELSWLSWSHGFHISI